MAAPGLFRFLSDEGHRSALVRLVAIMVAAALTEGFGLVLLVPMLGVLAGDADGGALGRWLGGIGVPTSLGPLLGLFVGLVIVRALLAYARTIAGQRFEIRVVDGLRYRAWSGLLHCDWRTASQLRQSGSASLLITNIDRIGFGISQVLLALATLVTLFGVGLAALAIAPLVALLAGLCGVIVILAYRVMRRRAAALGEALGKAYDDVYTQFNEGLGALRVIKSFGREEQVARRGAAAIAEMRSAQLAFMHDLGRAQVALQGIGALLLAGLVWVAIMRWDAGIAEILPLVALFARALPLLGGLQQAWQNWEHARPALDATFDLVSKVEAGREPVVAASIDLPSCHERIVLSGVSVTYPGRSAAALDDVTVTIPARGVTALAGPSGAGKSTLADLVAGLIEPDAGTIMIDGIALAGPARRAWRERVAYVQQEPVLFSGTIRDNFLWADPAADEARLTRVLQSASAAFVGALPDGLDTRVGEGGRTLSGGERQRVVLARALLRDPALLILDEAASALDPENEAAIAQAIANLRETLGIVIIGHRGPLAMLADHVIELRAGRIQSFEA